MSRVLLALLALLALTTAIAWYALAAGPTRTANAPLRAVAQAPEPAPSSVELVQAAQVESTSEAARPLARVAADARSAVPGASEAELDRAHWIEGRVVFAPGTPADEELFVVADGRDFEDGSDHRARVEADGRFRVAFSEATRTGRLRLEARYLILDPPRRWKRGETGPVVLEPVLGGRIVVRPAPPPGVPSEGRVQLARHERGSDFTYDAGIAAREVAQGAELAFDALLPERTHLVSFSSPHLIHDGVRVVVEPGRTHVVDLALRAGLVLRGRVLDEDAVPLAGVEVYAVVRSVSGTHDSRQAESAEDGSYRLDAISPGKGTLYAREEGYEPLEVEFEPAPGVLELATDLALHRGRAIAGSVRWPDGSPAQAHLNLTPIPESAPEDGRMSVEARADAQGTFAVSGLVAGAYHVRAWDTQVSEVEVESAITGRVRTRKQRATWSAEVERVAVGAAGLALVLGPGLSVRGIVRDGEGRPLDDVRVTSRRTSFPSLPWNPIAGPSDRFRNADGSFELTGFQPGTWELRASARDHAESDPIVVEVPAQGPLELVLELAAEVRGVVLDLDGRPSAGARVRAAQPDHRGTTPMAWNSDDPSDRTDDEGTFRISDLHAGRTLVSVSSPSGVPGESLELDLVAGESRADLVLHLRPACVLEGEVVDRHGRPEAGASVAVQVEQRGHYEHFTSDAEGRFTSRTLPAGTARLFATNAEGVTLNASAELRPDRVARVRLAPPEGRPVRLHGRVLVGGEPVGGAHVSARRENATWERSGQQVQGSEPSDERGAYELDLPGDGRWLVGVYGLDGGLDQWFAPVDVPPGEEFAHDLELEMARVSGRVSGPDGAPLARVWVQSEPQQHDGGARGSSSQQTDADGRYELLLPVGQHALVAGRDRGPWSDGNRGWCPARVDGVRLASGEHRRDVDFVLERGGTLRGVVRHADGSPASNAWLYAGDGSALEALAATDPHGSFQIEGLTPGTHALRAAATGAATPSALQVAVRAGEIERVELTLVPAVSVRVRVVDAEGAPLGSEIEAVDGDGLAVPQNAWGAQGEVRLGPLAPGTYRITARREQKVTLRTLEIAGGESELEVVLGFD